MHALVENDDAVRHVLLDSVAREPVLTPFPGHDRGDRPLLEPVEQPTQLRAHDRLGRNAPNSTSIVSRTTRLGPDSLDRVGEKDEQRLEIKLPRLGELRGIHSEGICDEQLVPLEPVEVEAQ